MLKNEIKIYMLKILVIKVKDPNLMAGIAQKSLSLIFIVVPVFSLWSLLDVFTNIHV